MAGDYRGTARMFRLTSLELSTCSDLQGVNMEKAIVEESALAARLIFYS